MYKRIKFDIFFLTVDFGGSFYRAKTRLQTIREMQQTNKVPLEGTNNSNAPLSSSYTNPDYERELCYASKSCIFKYSQKQIMHWYLRK